MKNVLKDIQGGWRARPVACMALAAIGISVGVFSAAAFRIWTQAEQESRRLVSAWPADRTRVVFPDSMDRDERIRFLQRLPPGSWWAWQKQRDILFVEGTLPPDWIPEQGLVLQPDQLRRGDAVAWASTASPWTIGERTALQGISFEVIGKTELPDSAKVLLPAALRTPADQRPDRVEIREPVSELRTRLQDLPFYSELSFLDHQQQRAQALKGFRRLTLNMTGLGAVIALLTAIVLQSIIRLELKERRFEFALRRSIGAQPSDIVRQILTEIFLILGAPSILGIVFFLPTLPLAGALLMVLLPLWFLICALPPALHAATLSPHEALKEG